MVNVTRTSPFTGKVNTMTLNISQAEFEVAIERWMNGALIQDALHMLDADEREFVMSGITPDEWDTTFGSEE